MKKTFGNLSDNFLSKNQMKMIKGGVEEDGPGGDDELNGRNWHQCCCPGAGCAWTYSSCSNVAAMGGREGCFRG